MLSRPVPGYPAFLKYPVSLQRASLVTPGLYPAFSSPPYFAAFGRGGFWIVASTLCHRRPTAALCPVEVVPIVLRGRRVTNRLTGAYGVALAVRRDLAAFISNFRSWR